MANKKHKSKVSTKTTIRREVIEGDIKKITKTTKVIEPAPMPSRPKADPDEGGLQKATNQCDVATDGDVAPADAEIDAYLAACRASVANGYTWVCRPCIKIMSPRKIYFNERAFDAFGLKAGMKFILGMTLDKQEIRIRKVRKSFDNRTKIHRNGCYRLNDETTHSRRCDSLMGSFATRGKADITLVAQNPGLVGYVFRLRQHPHDPDLLVALVHEGEPTTGSVAQKLTVRGVFDMPLVMG